MLTVALTLMFSSARPNAAEGHLNVLHIIVDDLRPALGCHGDPIAKTPAIDRLAKRGVQFDNAYVQYPICGPSRASFLSGLRPQTSGYFGWEFPPDATLMPTWFRQNGYFTAAFGKDRIVVSGIFCSGKSLSNGFLEFYSRSWQVSRKYYVRVGIGTSWILKKVLFFLF